MNLVNLKQVDLSVRSAVTPLAVVLGLGLVLTLALATPLNAADAAPRDSTAARLQQLEDREQILELLTAYGATLDARDFAGFGRLFAEDAVYGSGPSPTRGRAAIQAMLEKQLNSNPLNLPPPNFHIFFNPSIRVDGDKATAHSRGAYIAPDPTGKTAQMVFFVSYEDALVRREGRWLFQQRVIKGGIPAARVAAPPAASPTAPPK
jgi:uncharacterized protein (TIGR02246 family)